MHRAISCLIVAGLLTGCQTATGPLPGGVILTPSKTTYVPGEVVTAVVSNRSSSQIDTGACSLRAERHNRDQWELVGPEGVPCTLQLLLISANSDRTLRLTVPTPLTPGEYRLRFSYLLAGTNAAQAAYSSPITVQGAN